MLAHIVITGGSRGIGAAIALEYAAPGVRLSLVGRDAARLADTARRCRDKGADTAEIVCDVRDRPALADHLRAADGVRPVDLVVANAGVALPTAGSLSDDPTVYGEIDTNLVGALNSVLPLLPAMTARKRGQVAFISSLAAFAPLPNSPGYSASKAALLVYGLALRQRLAGTGVRVSVICPGYIQTEMGERFRGWRPLVMSADRAARRIRTGLEADRALIAFPRRLSAVARLSQLVPEGVLRKGMRLFKFRIEPPA